MNSQGWFPKTYVKNITYQALHDWSSDVGGYLTLERGTCIFVTYQGVAGEDDGWMYGTLGDDAVGGWFPAAAVKPV